MKRALVLVSLVLGCVPEATLDAGAGADAQASDVGLDAGAGARDAAEAVPDASTDSGPGDAGQPDTGAGHDAGQVDTGSPPDAGQPDAGTQDGGPASCELAGVNFDCEDVTTCAGAPVYGRCGTQVRNVCCLDQDPCSVDGAPGLCMNVAACPGTSTPGRCPGAAEIQCCTRPEEACDPNAAPSPNPALPEVSYDPRCPNGMVWAQTFCVDRFEASLLHPSGTPWSPYVNPGATAVRAVSLAYAVPQAYISGTQAAAACSAAGKRLCTDAEWLSACQGPASLTYPYGNAREPGRCNDARDTHPAYEYFGTTDNSVFNMLDNPCLNQVPAGLALTGQSGACESPVGAFDMMGNLHEWTADPAGTFRGGFYVDTRINGSGCLYRTTAHGASYWDYSTGFRCCADPL